MTRLLFVYGSLLARTAYPQVDAVLARCEKLPGTAYIHARLYWMGEYPGAIPAATGKERVWGALLRVAESDVAVLDEYEDYRPGDPAGSEFIRERAVAHVGESAVDCETYFLRAPPVDARPIASGDYLEFLRSGGRNGGATVPPKGETS